MPWSQEQIKNAQIIYQVGRNMGMSTRDIQIGLITTLVESNMINVNYGDRDSLGLFQQRPSQGWGSPEQVTNPEYAAGKFFEGLKGLGDRRYRMGMGEAAQAVQRSAFPDRYATRIGEVRGQWPSLLESSGQPQQTIDGNSYFGPQNNNRPDLASYLTGDDQATMYGGMNATMEPILSSPDPQAMLGAWGMGARPAQQVVGYQPTFDEDGTQSLINQHTNQYITELQEQSGPYSPGVDGWRKAVVETAKKALGTPYAWGGNSLANGVDCSGLIQQAYAAAGINVPRVSYQQANSGKRVGVDSLRAGDLVAWDNSPRNPGADHIAMYIGNGQIIEAARPGTSVRIRGLGSNEGAWGVRMSR